MDGNKSLKEVHKIIDIIEQELKVDIPYYFISSVAEKGLSELKDALWVVMNKEKV
jgi:GTP-binding protein